MEQAPRQDSLKEAIEIFQEGYASPAKALVWAKAVKEWGGIVVAGFLFVCVILFIILAMVAGGSRVKTEVKTTPEFTVRSAEPGSVDQQAMASQKLMPHLKDLLNFVALSTKSLNKRAEIQESLLEAALADYSGNQKALEQKLTVLAIILRRCTGERGKFVSQRANGPNPFEADISNEVKELMYHSQGSFWEYSQEGVPLDPQKEAIRWNRLCALCQQEVDKANKALLQAVEENAKP